MKIILSLLLFLSGCQSAPKLPRGSYVEGTAGYSKDEGATAGVRVRIPLDGYAK